MRRATFVLALLASACGQTTAAPPPVEAPVEAAAPAFALESEALIGRWSFDRTCGLYDLVFEADGGASYFDYSSDTVVSHVGQWAISDGNRAVLTTHVQGADGALGPDAETYNVDIDAPVTDDLSGTLSGGGEERAFNAKRCDETEDRE
jgi:hypothetical protein